MKRKLNGAKELYQTIVPPPVLGARVEGAIEAAKRPRHRRGWALRFTTCAAACLCGLFILTLNVSPTFAQSMGNMPVLGNVAKIFTFTSYERREENDVVRVTMPNISIEGNSELERRVNYEIMLKMDQLVDEARARATGYKEAFLATGGTEEEFIPFEITVDYAVHCNNSRVVSFTITKSETLASCYVEQFFYNIDLETGKELTLADLLGSDYIQRANAEIKGQMARRVEEDPDAYYYIDPTDGQDDALHFSTIAPDQDFYINEKGNVVIFFNKYEIAPGYMGQQTFEIPTPAWPQK